MNEYIVLAIGCALIVTSPLVGLLFPILRKHVPLPKMVMVHFDLETGGVTRGAAVFVIAAHAVNEKGEHISDRVYRIDRESALDYGFFDPATKAWWDKQSKEARFACFEEGPRVPLPAALDGLAAYIKSFSDSHPKHEVLIFGNSPSMDCDLLDEMYHITGRRTPWAFYQEVCTRSIARVGEWLGIDEKANTPFEGLRHRADHDARHQARYTSSILSKLGVRK